jgi:predicted phage-related endonuclease
LGNGKSGVDIFICNSRHLLRYRLYFIIREESKMSTAVINQKREQWLEERRKGIGGSDSGSLFPEDSKYGCSTRLWYEKRDYKPDYERTAAEKKILDRGNRLEDVVADQFSLEFDFKVRRHQTRVMDGAPFMRVNIDRQIVNVTREELTLYWPQIEAELQSVLGDGQCGPGVLECKTSNEWVVRDALKHGIVTDYIFQIQHALAVTGYKWGVMAILDTSTFELTCFPMVRNEKLISLILERGEKFWALVENGPKPDAPDFPHGDRRCLSCPFRKTCRGEQYLFALAGEKPDTGYVSDDSFAELGSDLRDVRQQLATLEQTEENIIALVQKSMAEKEISKLEIPSIGARVRWAEQKGRMMWDSKGLEAEGATIGRKIEFADWVESLPYQKQIELASEGGLLAAFCKEHPKSAHLSEKYKRPTAPVRPFHFVTL